MPIRDWARRDQAVAGVCSCYATRSARSATTPTRVEARSLLVFCMAIGNHYLAADHPGRTRAQVNARASDLILNRSPGNPAQ